MTESIELDHLDTLAAEAFPGYLVRKDLVRRYARQYPVPTYVVEFLLGRYCASVDEREIEEGLAIVERQLKGRTVRTSDQEIFKSRAREDGSVKLIDIVRARLDAKNDCYVAELPSLNLKDVQVADSIVKDNERMLADGFYAEVTLSYDPLESHDASAVLSESRYCVRSRCRSRTCSTCWPEGAGPSRRPSGATS